MTTLVGKRASRLSAERRQEIFEGVVELLVDRGYDATTIEDIAQHTKTSKATLYRNWVDKPTLVVTALLGASAIDVGTVNTGSFVTDMDCIMDMIATHVQRNIALTLTIAEAGRYDRVLRESLHQTALPELDVLTQIAGRAVERGEITDPAKPAHLRDLIMGSLFGSVLLGGTTDHIDAAYLRRFAREVIVPFVTSAPASSAPAS